MNEHREHDEDGRNCWCGPEVVKDCSQCHEDKNPGCWKCGGRGLVPADDSDAAVMIIHACPTCEGTHGCECNRSITIEGAGEGTSLDDIWTHNMETDEDGKTVIRPIDPTDG